MTDKLGMASLDMMGMIFPSLTLLSCRTGDPNRGEGDDRGSGDERKEGEKPRNMGDGHRSSGSERTGDSDLKVGDA